MNTAFDILKAAADPGHSWEAAKRADLPVLVCQNCRLHLATERTLSEAAVS